MKNCYDCVYFDEVYSMERNEDELYERVLVDTICTCKEKDNSLQSNCEYFKKKEE